MVNVELITVLVDKMALDYVSGIIDEDQLSEKAIEFSHSTVFEALKKNGKDEYISLIAQMADAYFMVAKKSGQENRRMLKETLEHHVKRVAC